MNKYKFFIALFMVAFFLLTGLSQLRGIDWGWDLIAPKDTTTAGDSVYFAWHWDGFYGLLSPMYYISLTHNGIIEKYLCLVNEGGVYEYQYLSLDPNAIYNFHITVMEGGLGSNAYEVSRSPVWTVNTKSSILIDNLDIFPHDFSLSQNYPNPFNPQTTIEYSLPKASHVVITVYNTRGQLVKTLFNGQKQAGSYRIIWDGNENPAGIYFLHFQAGDFNQTIKMVLTK